MSVGVLDFGVGNVGSILSMHRKLAIPASRVMTGHDLGAHERFILPGVGAFDRAMHRLGESGMTERLAELVLGEGRPLLGICLGMQMLADRSEEGEAGAPGLGWIPGVIRSMRTMLPSGTSLPFMGWAYIDELRPSTLFADASEAQRFYFVHSFAFVPDEDESVVATADLGAPITAVVNRANIWGTQFHPEKSHRFGMSLLQNFSRIECHS